MGCGARGRSCLEPSLRWTVDEIVEVLALIDEEQGVDHVYYLLVTDPAHAKRRRTRRRRDE